MITGLGRQAGSIGIHCHDIDGNRNNITILNTRQLQKKLNLVFDPSFGSQVGLVLAEGMMK
jgi:hypothetical protein